MAGQGCSHGGRVRVVLVAAFWACNSTRRRGFEVCRHFDRSFWPNACQPFVFVCAGLLLRKGFEGDVLFIHVVADSYFHVSHGLLVFCMMSVLQQPALSLLCDLY
jgi:hypothetical protein